MNTIQINSLASEIDNALELTSVCRGEWCNELEARVDLLEDELLEVNKECTVGAGCAERDWSRINEMSHKIMKSYNNLRGDFRL